MNFNNLLTAIRQFAPVRRVNGQTGDVVTPSGSANQPLSQIISGGGITSTTGYSFVVSAATYLILGFQYASAQTTVTLSNGDATNPRFDLIVVNSSGAVAVVAGTASATPVVPYDSLDPSTQLALTIVSVPAGSTSPTTLVTDSIYGEPTQPWPATSLGAPVDTANTTSPLTGATSILTTAMTLGNYHRHTKATDIDLASSNVLSFQIKPVAAWATGCYLTITALGSNAKQVGTSVILKYGSYGFDSASTLLQTIAIPTADFQAAGRLIRSLQFTMTRATGVASGTISYRMDEIKLQGGVGSLTPSNAMVFASTWNSAAFYTKNKVVISSGISYIALTDNTNKTPSSNASDWAFLGGSGLKEIPQNSQSAAYTTVLTDSGKHIYHPSADTTARIFTIDSNANVAYLIGTAITFINDTGAGVVTIAITADTMVLAGTGTTGSRTLAANGIATAIKITSTRWMISGTGLT